jgi:cobalt/nickel transport system permease protein
MHISEGILSAPVLVGGGALAAAGIAIGLKKMDYDRIMTVSILTSTFFVASLIHVPIGPGSIHLALNGLLGIILGWASVPAIFVGLLLQAIFFQYGGITVLGVNTVIMAGPALACYYLVRRFMGREKLSPLVPFVGGFLAIALSVLYMAAALAISDTGFIATAKIVLIANLPIMLIEGFVTMFVVLFLARVQPDILTGGRA